MTFTFGRAAFGVLALATLLVPSIGQASPFGDFTIVGLGNVRVGDSWIDFGKLGLVFQSPNAAGYVNCDPGANPGACIINGTTTGDILFTGGTGSFLPLIGTNGTIKDLEDDFAPTGAVAPPLMNFLTAPANPALSFNLTFLPAGTGTAFGCTNTPGDVCTPPGSPFTITNGALGNSSVTFSVRGTVSDGVGIPSDFEGTFSTQFTNLTALGLLTQIATNGFVQSSHSADFVATVIPEPSTVSLVFGGGLLLLAGAIRRRRQS